MPRENSFSDENRSLTPELNEGHPELVPSSPTRVVVIQSPEGHQQQPRSPQSPLPPHRRRTSASAPSRAHSSPKDRFRAAVRKVMFLRRMGSSFSKAGIVGAEPGVDPRRESASINYGHIKENCTIEITDYSSVRGKSFGTMNNQHFIELLNDPTEGGREPWVKARWINVGGISWDVLSAIAIKYDIHPLALEDIIHQRVRSRSKADYYRKHLFLQILCHTLAPADEITLPGPCYNPVPAAVPHPLDITDLPRTYSPIPFLGPEQDIRRPNGREDGDYDEETTVYGDRSAPGSRFSTLRKMPGFLRRRPFTLFSKGSHMDQGDWTAEKMRTLEQNVEARENNAQNQISIEELKKGFRVNVKMQPMYIFLLRDGTVISIHPTPDLSFTSPIANRLRLRDSLLRTTTDPSMLVQSLLDLIVDRALEVVDEYHGQILMLERDILIKPRLKTVRHLHILSGDLILHKRTLEPIKTVIYALRRYDLDRAAALIDTSQAPPGNPIEGFMSHKAKIYLADVHDHMEYILNSLDMISAIAENLISYTFNSLSNEMNEIMRSLTLVTIIMLPLSFLTGYFGMNFENMWSIHHGHSDVVFWIIALPVMSFLVPVFLRRDIYRVYRYVDKRMRAARAVSKFKSA